MTIWNAIHSYIGSNAGLVLYSLAVIALAGLAITFLPEIDDEFETFDE